MAWASRARRWPSSPETTGCQTACQALPLWRTPGMMRSRATSEPAKRSAWAQKASVLPIRTPGASDSLPTQPHSRSIDGVDGQGQGGDGPRGEGRPRR